MVEKINHKKLRLAIIIRSSYSNNSIEFFTDESDSQQLGFMTREKGYNIITKGTDSHVLLLDLSDKLISGREAADLLEVNDITVNKNGVPNDPRNFIETSGIRIGTAAETTRGKDVEDFKIIAEHMINIMEGQ